VHGIREIDLAAVLCRKALEVFIGERVEQLGSTFSVVVPGRKQAPDVTSYSRRAPTQDCPALTIPGALWYDVIDRHVDPPR